MDPVFGVIFKVGGAGGLDARALPPLFQESSLKFQGPGMTAEHRLNTCWMRALDLPIRECQDDVIHYETERDVESPSVIVWFEPASDGLGRTVRRLAGMQDSSPVGLYIAMFHLTQRFMDSPSVCSEEERI